MTARNNIFSTFSRRVDVLLLAVCLRSGTSCFLIQNNPSFVPGHNIQNRPPFVRYSHQDDSLTENEDKIKHLNPNMDPLRKSISDINYSQVILGLDNLYPPNELSQRISKSRSDGYWSYVEDGMKPSQELTYGEFDFYFFAELLDRACHHYYRNEDNVKRLNNEQQNGLNGKTFVDIGSGTGRLVIGAAALHPGLSLSKGIEILPGIHESAIKFLGNCRKFRHFDNEDEIIIDLNNSLQKHVNVNREESSDEEGIEIYDEPLSNEMNAMINSLQEMTPEEWEAILSGVELDEDLLSQNEDKDVIEVLDDAIETKNQTIESDTTKLLSDDSETILDNNEDDDFSREIYFEAQRLIPEQINPFFTLPSEEDLLKDLNKEEDDNIECNTEPYYFESFEEFLQLPNEELDYLFNHSEDHKYREKTFSSSETENEEKYKVDNDVDEVPDTTTFYSLYCPDNDDAVSLLPLAPVEFSCGSYEDPYEYIGDADIVFVFSTCWTEDMMSSLSECIGRQCKPGTIAITTEFSMPLKGEIGETLSDPSLAFGKYELELVEEVDGFCWLTGGTSTAYIHRVVSSLWEEGAGPRQKPRVEPKEVAWKIIQEYESNRLTDSSKFVRNAKNALAFYNFKNPQQPL